MAPGKPAAALLLLAVVALPVQAQLPALPAELPVYEYHSYDSLTADLQRLAAEHEDIARLTSLGQSRLGLELWNLEIGEFGARDHDARPGFYLDGGHHGNEALGIEAAYLFAEWLVEGYGTDPEATALVQGARLFVTPLVNPDGKTLDQRQNGAMVNLNRNYPFHWNERGTGPLGDGNYAGPSEGSEPETQANMAFLEERGIEAYVSLHTGSYDMVRPFGYAPDEPVPDEALYQHLFAWADANAGLESRYPGGSGESICWAYGAQGIFSVLLEVYAEDLRSPSGAQLLGGPLTRAEVEAALEPHLAVIQHVAANAGKWGGRLEAGIEGVRGSDATLVLRNAGFAEARNVTIAGTGLQLLGPAPASLLPGAEARVPVRLEAPAQAWVRYERLAVQPEQGAAAFAVAEAQVEFHTAPLEARGAPGFDLGLLAVALAGAALLRRR